MAEGSISIGIKLTIDGKNVEGAATLTKEAIAQLGAEIGNTDAAAKKLNDTQTQFISLVQQLNATTQQLITSMHSNTDAIKDHTNEVNGLGDAFQKLGQQLKDWVIEKLKEAAAALGLFEMGRFIEETSRLAAEHERLGVVLSQVGKNAGYTSAQIDQATATLHAHDLTLNQAEQSSIKLIRAHVDLAQSEQLVTLAQNAGAASGISTAEALNKLTFAAQTGATRQLRHMSIIIDSQAAYKAYADQLNKTNGNQEASLKTLSDTERTQAIINALLAQSGTVAGAYGAAIDTVAKRLQVMHDASEDAKTMIGEIFNGALLAAVSVWTTQLEGSNASLEKNKDSINELRQYVESLALVIGVMVDGIMLMVHAWQSVVVTVAYVIDQVITSVKFGVSQMIDPMNTLANLRKGLTTLASNQIAYEQSLSDTWAGGTDRVTNAIKKQLEAQDAQRAAALKAGEAQKQASADAEQAVAQQVQGITNWYMLGNMSAKQFADSIKAVAEAAKTRVAPPDGSENRVRLAKVQGGAVRAEAVASAELERTKSTLSAQQSLYKLYNDTRLMSDTDLLQKELDIKNKEVDAEIKATQIKTLQQAKLASAAGDADRAIAITTEGTGKVIALEEKRKQNAFETADAMAKLLLAAKQASDEADIAIQKAMSSAQSKGIENEAKIGGVSQIAGSDAKYADQLKQNQLDQQGIDLKLHDMQISGERFKNEAEYTKLLGQKNKLGVDANAIELEASVEHAKSLVLLTSSNAELGKTNEDLERQIRNYGLSDAAVADLSAKEARHAAAILAVEEATVRAAYAQDLFLAGDDATKIDAANAKLGSRLIVLGQQRAALLTLAAAQDRFADGTRKLNALQNPFAPMQLSLSGMVDTFQAVSDAAKGLSDTLSAGFGGMASALSTYSTQLQAAADQNLKNKQAIQTSQDASDVKAQKQQAEEIAYQSKIQALTLHTYTSMADAAQTFFKKGSAGYNAMGVISKAFHAAELADAIFNALMKIALEEKWITIKTFTALTGMQVDQTATDAGITNSVRSIPADAASGGAKMFAQSGWGGFAGVALMIALLASLGFAMGGGGGGGGTPAPPDFLKTNINSTAMGGANSDSIDHSLKILQDNSSQDLNYTSAMLNTLMSIDDSMKGMANLAARLGLLPSSQKAPSSQGGNTFSIDETGVIIGQHTSGSSEHAQFSGQTVNQLLTDPYAQSYQAITRTHSGSFGSTYSATNYDYAALAQEFSDQIKLATKGISTALAEALNILTGGKHSIEDIEAALGKLNIDVHTISFKDMQGGDVQTAIEQAFSAIGDDMAQGVLTQLTGPDGLFSADNLGKLSEFQHVGEGAFETVIRVASGVEKAKSMLDQFGISMIKWQDIVNKQGDVTTELVRQSIMNTEHIKGTNGSDQLSGVGQILQGFSGTADDLVALYQKLLDLRVALRAVGTDADQLDINMISGAGGIQKFSDGLKTFNDKFFTAGEQWHSQGNELVTSFTKLKDPVTGLNLAMPNSREGFRQMVQGIDLSTASGRTLYGQLIALAPAFDQVVGAIEDIRNSITDMFNSTRRTISMAGKDSQGKYNFLMDEAASLETQALNSKDPQQIQKWATQINDDINQAFGMLTPEQQQAQAPQWLTRLDDVNTKISDHLKDLPDTLTAINTTLTTVNTTLTTTADANTTAANTNLTAANTQLTASNNQLTASETPAEVHVAVTVDGGVATVNDGG